MNELKQIIIEEIRANGPMPLEDYMARALGDNTHGYYTKKDPFGKKGDFITAPETSQVFGELIGLWGLDFWINSGLWSNFNLAELGPGRGTLMADLLRSTAVFPAFHAAVSVHLVDASPHLRGMQRALLGGGDAVVPARRGAACVAWTLSKALRLCFLKNASHAWRAVNKSAGLISGRLPARAPSKS